MVCVCVCVCKSLGFAVNFAKAQSLDSATIININSSKLITKKMAKDEGLRLKILFGV